MKDKSNKRTLEEHTSNPAAVGEWTIPLTVNQSNSLTKKTSVTKMRGKSVCCQRMAGILKAKVKNCTQSDTVAGSWSHI